MCILLEITPMLPSLFPLSVKKSELKTDTVTPAQFTGFDHHTFGVAALFNSLSALSEHVPAVSKSSASNSKPNKQQKTRKSQT